MFERLRDFEQDRSATTALRFSLIAALISVVCITVLLEGLLK